MSERIDLTGRRYGRLTVESYAYTGKYGKAWWTCKCDCGTTLEVLGESLKTHRTSSCGCLRKDYMTSHGMSYSRLFSIYQGIIQRCMNPHNCNYFRYGGRGITICEEWIGEDGFKNFTKWSLEHGYGDDLSIDRIDVNGNYEPSNCRWATNIEQQYNRRSTARVNYHGQSLSMLELSRVVGIPRRVLYRRIFGKKMPLEKAVSLPYEGKEV